MRFFNPLIYIKKNKYKYFALLIVVIIFSLESCTTKKKLTNTPAPVNKNINIAKLISDNYLKYTTLTIRYNVKLESDKSNYNFSGQIRIKNDSICWINASPALGIEVARIIFTNDSIKLLNRFENNYTLTNYTYLKKIVKQDIDYKTLQSILTNELFLYPFIKGNLDDYSSTEDSVNYNFIYMPDSLNKNIVHIITINKKTNKIENVITNDISQNKKLLINYSNFELENGVLFPKYINIEILTGKDKMKLNIDYSKISIDKEQNYPFNIPDKFEKIDL